MKERSFILALIIITSSILIITSRAQQSHPNPAVLDSSGNPLRRNQKYFIKTKITETNKNPMVTLLNRTAMSSSTMSVGLEDDVSVFSSGLPLVLSPFIAGEKTVREMKNFKVGFSNSERGESVIVWRVGLREARNQRRFIITGDNVGYSNYFHLSKLGHGNSYGLRWCPTEICGACKFVCGDVGVFVENGKRFLALDGDSVLPIVFVKA